MLFLLELTMFLPVETLKCIFDYVAQNMTVQSNKTFNHFISMIGCLICMLKQD